MSSGSAFHPFTPVHPRPPNVHFLAAGLHIRRIFFTYAVITSLVICRLSYLYGNHLPICFSITSVVVYVNVSALAGGRHLFVKVFKLVCLGTYV
jgi:hypothetical protein